MKLIAPLNTIEKIKTISQLNKMNVALTAPDLYLSSSILLETACTLCLSNVNDNKLLFIPIYIGYGVSFYFFPKCLSKYSLSTAYTMWSGFGIIFTFIIDILLKKEIFKIKKLIGITTVIYGISIIK